LLPFFGNKDSGCNFKKDANMNAYIEYGTAIKETLDQLAWQEVQKVVMVLHQAWLANSHVFIMGNGGSAATASHLACDLGKNTAVADLPRLRVMALNDNMAWFSAHANDNGYENVFAEQLCNFVRERDVVIAISASGNSANVLKAVERARLLGAFTIGWSGYAGGRLAQIVDISVIVPNHCIEQIEDIHLMLGHIVTTELRQHMRDFASVNATVAPTLPTRNAESDTASNIEPHGTYIMQAAAD
jgi:D-sedoheptulose 7-phosphate isomerase